MSRRLIARRTLLAAAALALAGCAGTGMRAPASTAAPRPRLPDLAAPAGATVVPGLAIDRWWTLFGDAALDRRVEQALLHNEDLALAAARLREARARLDEALGGESPSLQLQASSVRSRLSADSIGAPAGRTGGSQRAALVADYEVDLWGRLAAASDGARARLAAQSWNRASIEWGLTAQIAEAHFSARALQRQIEIGEAVRTLRARSAALRRTELQAGAGSEFELRRAEAELAAAESTLAALQRRRLALEQVLALLAGDATDTLGQPGAAVAALDAQQPFEPRLPEGEIGHWLQQRPDLRQAEAELAATSADVQQARAATLPALRLSGNVGGDARELSRLFHGPGFAWSIAGALAQSLFDGGRARARVAQAEARADAALAQYRRRVAVALTELREAYAALDLAERTLAAERRRVAALDHAQRLAQLGERAGALNQLDRLDAERNHFQAQLAEVDAYRDRLLGQVALFKALGGGHGAVATTPSTAVATTPSTAVATAPSTAVAPTPIAAIPATGEQP